MNPHKQLLRQPIRTLAMLFLLCVVSAFLCLGFGVLRSAGETLAAIEDQFITVVFPRFTQHTERLGDGITTVVEDYSPEEQSAILELAKTSSFSKGNIYQNYISAYSPSLAPVTSAQEDGHYDSKLDAPYNRAIFAITVTGWEMLATVENYYTIYGTIDEAIALHDSYVCRETIEVLYYHEAEKEAFPFREGGRYWLYGEVVDLDLNLRQWIAVNIGYKTSEISWDYVVENPFKDVPGWPFDREELWYEGFDGVAKISLGDRLKDVGVASLSIIEIRSIEADPAAQKEEAKWTGYGEALEITYRCVPVLGTDLLEGIYPFHENKAFLTRGRSFDWEDYKSGNPVCIISETLAASSGLTVGDTIPLSFYNGGGGNGLTGNPVDEGANPMAKPFGTKEAFIGEAKSYEIIGLYRQERNWESGEAYEGGTQSGLHTFTPNTVFVPNASLEGLPTYTSDQGIFSTIVLENGSIEKLKAALTEAGLSPEALTYFDGGYSEIAETLDGFQESAKQLFYASVLTWIAAVVVYLILFVRHQRRNVGLMCSLGSGKGKAARFVWVISMLPVGVASVVGALVGMALMRGTLEKVFASVQDVLSTDFSSTVGGHISIESTLVSLPWTAAVAALGQALVLAGVIWLCAHALASRKPLDNISAGGK